MRSHDNNDAGTVTAAVLARERVLDERLAAARAAAEQITAWQAILVEEVRGCLAEPMMDRPGLFLAHQLGLTPGEMAQVLELVDRLDELPRVAELLASGERSLSTVLSIARRATPDNETVLVERSVSLTAGALQRMLREYDRVRAPSDRDPFDAQHDPLDEPTTLRLGTARNGRRRATIDLDAADAAELAQALDAEVRRRGDAEEEGFAARADLSRGAAFMSIVTASRSRDGDCDGFASDAVQSTLVIHATEGPDGLAVDRAVLDGDAVPGWMITMLVERGELTAMVAVDGQPVIATSPLRFATRAQRRALLVRDGGCTYPGCGSTRGLIAHHVTHWDDGGPTRLDNLALLCRHHHRIVHRYRLRLRHTDRWIFEKSDGRPLDPVRPRRPIERTSTGSRRRGFHEPLTEFARDVILHTWLTEAA